MNFIGYKELNRIIKGIETKTADGHYHYCSLSHVQHFSDRFAYANVDSSLFHTTVFVLETDLSVDKHTVYDIKKIIVIDKFGSSHAFNSIEAFLEHINSLSNVANAKLI